MAGKPCPSSPAGRTALGMPNAASPCSSPLVPHGAPPLWQMPALPATLETRTPLFSVLLTLQSGRCRWVANRMA